MNNNVFAYSRINHDNRFPTHQLWLLQSHKRHSRENSSRKMIEINLGFFIQRREVLVVEYTKMQFLINYHAFID